ncbi:MAG: hypothetical protein LBC31_11615 [Treponema sp.]|nr:hypothetical protein [Treponema sp.]
MALEKDIRERLAKTFHVPEDRCEDYYRMYNETLLPLIQEKFLAHLVSVAEDLIFKKIKANAPKAPPFRIILWKNAPINGKATMRRWPYGAIIAYNPQNDYRDLRVFVAHELGHLLCRYKILDGEVTDNNADLLAFFAISGKNTFYSRKAPKLIYTGGELQIISDIQAACPITKEDQF